VDQYTPIHSAAGNQRQDINRMLTLFFIVVDPDQLDGSESGFLLSCYANPNFLTDLFSAVTKS
jgi:hypothetical protein